MQASWPRVQTRTRPSAPSAVRFVLVGPHELHPIDRDVLLLDGLLHTTLVLPEGLGARVPAPVPLQEVLREPAVEALVVLALELRAGLPDAVHLRGSKQATPQREIIQRRDLLFLQEQQEPR
ncbi:hypothetical protein CHARACLAT_025983 [Characodon lateralis]|uniref:Uncharacterized protein n=1 Tax=Characodon lateralis TaxID=208331 RepID=A0ABU7CTI6_9TELE|nr:hypothetical protein [Characodon lateralis]